MKTLRLFGMAIVAVMLAMPATSCDDDDDDDNTQIETTEDGIVTGQKKLVKNAKAVTSILISTLLSSDTTPKEGLSGGKKIATIPRVQVSSMIMQL